MQYGGMLGVQPRSSSSSGSGGSLSDDEVLQAQRLMHYKTYGEESYVFQHKDVWENFLQSFVAINDPATSTLATNFALNQGGHVGKYIKGVYGMPEIESGWDNLPTISSVVNSLPAVEAGLNHMTFSETMARLIVDNKSIEDIAGSNEYISIIINSHYGRISKTTRTSFAHPAILLSGVSKVGQDWVYVPAGTRAHGIVVTGYYWVDIGNITHTLRESYSNTVSSGSAGSYSDQTFSDINACVRSLPTISKSVYIYDGKSASATASHTYIPLYFED